MSSDYGRSGIRRSGDDYQDIVALQTIVDLLEHPERYQWIQVEADDKGTLDDIVVVRKDGSFELIQVKFSGYPEKEADNWTWEKLLDSKEKRFSLLASWILSFEKIEKQGKILRASVVTNRKLDEEISAILNSKNQIDIEKVDDEIVEEINSQVGNKELATRFFRIFKFEVDKPTLETLENAVERRFSQMGVGTEGWKNIKDQLRSWVRKKNLPPPEGKITLEIIRRACLWHQFEIMHEEFPFPEDFVLPSKEFHTSLQEEIQKTTNRCIVITANPGVGKSTYLSYLHKELSQKDLPVIRHHYFISTRDPTRRRFDYKRIAESLMNQLRNRYFESIGELGNENANYTHLHKWLTKCGKYWKERKKPLVLIIDGIDHVWRERKSIDDLNDFFDIIFPPPEGIVVIVGTQPIEVEKIPTALLRQTPRETWRELPCLELAAVKRWVRFHENLMKLPSEPERKNNVLDLIAGEFYAKSKGHPLYLHYSIKSILERGLELNSSNIKGLPDLPQDLSEYYSAVQTGLPELAIQILHLFSITPFVWTQKGILECLEPIIPDSSRVVESIRNIGYLLKKEGNRLTIFHNSLMEFLLAHSEHVTYSNRLRPLLLKWLEEKASDYLRESYLWLINAEGGNEDPLVDGPTRDWVVNSISKPLLGVSEILTRSAICALKKGKLDRFVTITFLRNYYDYAKDFRSNEFDNLFYTQLNVNNDPYFLESSISFLIEKTNKQLRFIAEMNVENQPLVKKCLNELTERLRGNRFSLYEEDISTAFVSFLQVAAICDDLDLQDLVDKLLDERFQNNKPHPISVLSNSMRVYNRAGPILNLLKANLPAEIFYIVLKDAILLSFEEGFDLTQEVLKNRSNPFAAIHGYLLNLPNFSIDSITFPSFSLHNMRESEKYFKKNEIMQTFYNIFFAFLSNHLWDKEEENSNWIATTPLDMWPTNFVEEMNDATKELAQLIKSKGEFHLDWLYDKFSSIRRPTWPEGRNDIIYGECAETALNKTALDIFIIFGKIGKKHDIEIEELEKAFLSSYCSPWNWLEEYTTRRRRLLSDDCLTFVGSSLEAEVKSSIELFSDRAKKYNQLAKLFTIHDSKDEARTYLSKVAENLLTYGDHKDVLLFGIFDIMEACYDVNIPEAKNWLKKIIPAITYVNQYTDGDETNHLPSELGEFLAKYEPKMATNYYRWLQNEEQYHYALDTFNSFLKYADLENPVVESIAKTAVDNESILILSKRKSEGTKGAGNVLSAIEKLLGEGVIEKITQKQDDNKRNDETLFRARKELPNPSEYPPERFEDYLTDAEEIEYFSNSVERWIAYWRNTSHKEQAYSSILQAIKKGTTLRGYDSLFDFSLSLRGRQEAYQWLVKANIEEYGWNLYWTKKEKAINRWNIIKDIYPDKWFDFIIDSLEPLIKKRWGYSTDSFVRLVEYCFYMEKPELAKKIANQAVDSTLELVSPLELPEPEWLEDE